jgi:GT2 family glycosyltransferase
VRGQTATEPLKSFNVETPPPGERSFHGAGDGSLNGASTSTCDDLNEAGGRLNATVPVVVHHIIQDGGSTDGSVEFLKEYAARHPSPDTPAYTFSYSSERDAGMYDAINKAWERGVGIVGSNKCAVGSDGVHSTFNNSQSTILSWLNSDEQYLPGTLQKVADYFESHPDVDAVFGDTIITTSTGVPYAARKEIPLRKIYVANGFLYALSCSTFFRRSLWDSGLLKLDTQYRYSADLDLVLRLLSQGVRFGHINDFVALFGVEEGKNLSFRPEMKDETIAIQKKYGSFSSPVLRKAIMICRYAERLLGGCYRPVPVSFEYAVNENADYRECMHPELGFRFTYSGFKEESGGHA